MTRRQFISAAAGLCLTVLLPSSCSIKEDRSVCPCLLTLDYSMIRYDERFLSEDRLLVMIPDVCRETVRMSEYPAGQGIDVPRRPLDLSCHLGFSEERLGEDGRSLLIPLGEDSDRLYSFRETLFLDGGSEEQTVSPVLCGESTRVVVEFEQGAALPEDYLLVATGGTCGEDLQTGEPIEGEFCCIMDTYNDAGARCFDMPRQARRDISIAVVSARTGNLLFTIDLAGELSSAGFDWNAASLPPLVILTVLSRDQGVDVCIVDWDEAVYLDFSL